VWEKSPSTTTSDDWYAAQRHCTTPDCGESKGLAAPTVQELGSLLDPSVGWPGPTLPAGHPFFNVQTVPGPGHTYVGYWTITFVPSSTDPGSYPWVIGLHNSATVGFSPDSNDFFAWCVRGGQGVDSPVIWLFG